MSLGAFGETLPQAVGIAVSPVPVALLLLMLVSARGRTNGPAFAVGWTAGLLAAAAVSFSVSDATAASGDAGGGDGGGGSGVQVAVGLLFVVLALRQWWRRPRPDEEPSRPRVFDLVDSFGPARAFGLGVGIAVVNPKDLTLAIDAGVVVAGAAGTSAEGALALVLFSLTASVTVLVPVVVLLALGDRATGALHALKDWLLAHNSTILLLLFAALAVKFLVTGLGLVG